MRVGDNRDEGPRRTHHHHLRLELIRNVIKADETGKQNFSGEEPAELAERRAQPGDQAITDVQAA